MNRNEIVKAVTGALIEAHKSLDGQAAPETVWTRGVKERLCATGKKRGFGVAASGCNEATWGEWLYDLCWLDYEPDCERPEYLKEVPLIAESEWGNMGDIEDDFEKLLAGRATVKLLVFDGRVVPLTQAGDRLAFLLGKFAARDPSDCFLLAAYTERGFECASLSGDGRLSAI